MIKSHLLRNPFTVWLRALCRALFICYSNRGKHLKLGYMTDLYNCHFSHYNTIYDEATLAEVELGDFTYIGKGCRIHKTKIGKFCSIGPDIKCGLGRHPSHTFVSTHPVFYSTRKQSQITFADRDYFAEFASTVIGNDVWIGANAVIVDGAVVGDGAIIAASSVVTTDVPPYAIVAGCPAKVVRYRFTEEQIQALLQLKWWDQELGWIKDNYLLFHDVGLFIKQDKPMASRSAEAVS